MERGGVGSAISLSRTCPAYLDWSRKQEPIVPRREPGKGGTRGGAAPPARSSPGLGAPGSPLTQPARGSSPGTEREVPLLPRCAHGDSVATLAPASSPFPAGSPEEAVFPARLRWHCRIDGSGWGLAAAGARGGGGARGRSRDVPVMFLWMLSPWMSPRLYSQRFPWMSPYWSPWICSGTPRGGPYVVTHSGAPGSPARLCAAQQVFRRLQPVQRSSSCGACREQLVQGLGSRARLQPMLLEWDGSAARQAQQCLSVPCLPVPMGTASGKLLGRAGFGGRPAHGDEGGDDGHPCEARSSLRPVCAVT